MTAACDGSADSVENHNNCGGIATDKSSAQTAAAAAAVAAAATVAVAVAEGDAPASVPMPLPLLPARTKGGYQHCSDCIHRASKGPLLSSPACLDLQAKTTKLQAVVGVFLPLLPYFLCVLFCRPHFFKLPSIRSVETNATRPALFQLWSGGSVAQHATKLWGATLACRAAARWSKDSSTRRQARCANIRQGKKAKTCLPCMFDANPKVQKPKHTRRTSTAGALILFAATTITTATTTASAFACPTGVRLALTPALYKQGRDAFKCATHIPDYAFCEGEYQAQCSPPGPLEQLEGGWVASTGIDSVVLKDMMYLEFIGLKAFKQFHGSIELSGDLRALQMIGSEVFSGVLTNVYLSSASRSLNIDLSGAQSLRTIGGKFGGSISRFDSSAFIVPMKANGLFPKFQGCFQFKDSNRGLTMIPPNAVVLTPALYKQGYNVYKDATCIVEEGFYNRDVPINDTVVLEDLGQLTGIGEKAFGNGGFTGTIIFQGKFPKLTTIGRYTFNGNERPESLIDLKGADFPLLEIFPDFVFNRFKGTIRISGSFASLKEIREFAFLGAGNADSFINLGSLPALTSIGGFYLFQGLLTIDCGDCELLTEIDSSAFKQHSNVDSRVSFTGLAQLQKIGAYAFSDYKGILNLQFDAVDDFTTVGVLAFSGTSNTKSCLQLPYDFALLEDALEKDGFGGYVFTGNETTTTRTTTTATTTTTTTYPAGSECSVADNFRYSAAAAIDNTVCTDEPNICRFQCCAVGVTGTCRACDADTGACYDHLQLSPAGAAIAAETTSTWQDTPLFSGKRYSPPRIALEDEKCAVFRGSRCYPLTSLGASDIRFQLMWGTPTNADDDKFNYVGGPPPLGLSKPGEGQDDPGGVSVINALTGEISASPLRNGSYTLWLLVYDSAAVDPDRGSRPPGIPQVFDQAVFARWDFEVQPTPKFNLQKGSSRTRAGREITDPMTIDGNNTFYAVGGTYKIAPLEVLETTTFSTVGGTLDSLRYALNGSLPDGLFVKTTSGDILVTFDPSNEGETYTVDLNVIDGVERRNLERMTMPVKYRDIEDPDPSNKAAFGPNKKICQHDGVPVDDKKYEFDGKYQCDCSSTGFEGGNCEIEIQRVTSCPEENATLVEDSCKYFNLDLDKSSRNEKNGTDYTDPIAMAETYYAVGKSYRVAPFKTLSTTVPSIGGVSNITYTLNADAPDSFFLSTTSGELFWRFGAQDNGTDIAVTLYAVDKGGARQEVETMVMSVTYNDVDVPLHGPNNKECQNEGIPTDTNNTFDGVYTCTCVDGWDGDNCETIASNCKKDKEIVLDNGNCTACLFSSVPNDDQTECVVEECEPLALDGVCTCEVAELTNEEDGFVNVRCNGASWPVSDNDAVLLPPIVSHLSFSAVEPARLAALLNASVLQSKIGSIIVTQDSFSRIAKVSSSQASATSSNETSTSTASASQSIALLPGCTEMVPAALDIKIGVGSICEAGTYADISNNGVCTSCERGGFYSETEGKVGYYSHCACSACQSGTWSQSPGSSTQVCDVCPQGTTRDSPAQYRACPCLDNWSRKDRFGECESCEGKLGIECSGDARVLKAGFYWEFPSQEEEQEYIRFTENLAKSYDYDRNRTMYEGNYPKAYACPGGNATCLGFNSSTNQSSSCKPGTDGVKCAVCTDDYFRINGECTMCPTNLGSSIAITILILLVFIALICWVFNRNAQDVPFIGDVKDKVESAFSLIDSNNDGTVSKEELAAELTKPGGELVTMLEAAGISTAFYVLEQMDEDSNGNIDIKEFKAALQSSSQRCISCFTSFATNKCKFHDHDQVNFMTMAKIIISYTQLKSLLVEVYPGAPWPDSYRSATSALQFLSSNPLSVMMPSCLSSSLVITSYSEMVMSSMAPLIFAPLIWLYYKISSRFSNDAKQLQAVCISTASFAFYLLYPTITVSAVRVLAKCDIICTDEAETENCISYLQADYSIACGTGAEKFHEYSNMHTKYRAIAAVSFVVYAIVVPLIIGWKIRHNKHVRKDEQQKAKAQGMTTDAVGMSAFVAGLSFYAAPYRKGFYLWETVDLFRKLLVVSIIVFIADGTSLQLAVGVMFALGGLVLQLMYKPFLHPTENALAAVSQGIIVLTLVVGGLLRSSEAEVAAMMKSGDVDSFVAGVYMITSGALLYVIAAVIWFGNPLACLCHLNDNGSQAVVSQELGTTESNQQSVAVSETRFDTREMTESSDYLVVSNSSSVAYASDNSDDDIEL